MKCTWNEYELTGSPRVEEEGPGEKNLGHFVITRKLPLFQILKQDMTKRLQFLLKKFIIPI
jgi:hypothetical protein